MDNFEVNDSQLALLASILVSSEVFQANDAKLQRPLSAALEDYLAKHKTLVELGVITDVSGLDYTYLVTAVFNRFKSSIDTKMGEVKTALKKDKPNE